MVISQTPLRISFCGGGTDLESYWSKNQGKVLTTAIDKYIYVIIKKRFDDDIVLNYTRREVVSNRQYLKHDLVREALKKTDIDSGVEIWTPSDIPSKGSGLGSSSTLTVGLLNAFYSFRGKQIEPDILASEACNIEIDTINKPIGKQDQYSAAYGGMNIISFHTDGTVSLKPVSINRKTIKTLESNILLFFTGIVRKSFDILIDQESKISKTRNTLNKMKSQVSEMCAVLRSESKLDDIGRILNEAWNYKKRLSKRITNSHIEQMYSKALLNSALGGKICGAGGGGFLMLYVPRENQQSVRKALQDYRELPFMLNDNGSKIIFNN